MWRKAILLSSLGFVCSAQADLQHYVASLDDSMWRISQNSPIECRLEHDIPDYGKAVFTSRAGKDLNLNFTLDMWNKPDQVTNAELISKAPQWRPGVNEKAITKLKYQKQFNGEVPKQAAWSMLSELSKGMQPTFYYADWYNQNDKVAVGLSAANFGGQYRQFRSCLSTLLPYGFDDIAFTVLNYEEGGTNLTRFSKQQLNRVQEYLSYDSDVELIFVDAYTDSYGGRSINQRVSERRADSVADLLVASGIEESRIHKTGHGERRHVASNNLVEERARNRRVVIKISKSI
ncbi:OmpA family protein [Shewanella sp. 1_MG-2023]|uniref:OmpA family protein n=1 Tax=Shewanella electrodiphila TaxID=934143 RepID=A0ABT0KQD5_9GAMM|nr:MULTISPECIES: OmpA family protein [Shewanella]MCC4831474.1 OmpA family protein [Shewanella sp. 10N.7]MCL1046056.1 OmpA family protein [Shewanella electrodiphila]MDO6612127.1 OmpA family protein [Shewanella sp. 7_MG-2023]MDO6771981.1 OmpA family protein [Shewanella sp. 2_MG-2023]MDO6796726.1 OmpA family protein [Shewanella sp. 1_MG-2023]